MRAPVIPGLGNLKTCGTQVISGPRHPWNLGLAGLSRFSPPGTLGTGGTPSLDNPLGTLGAGGTPSYQPPGYPMDWRDSVLSALLAHWELVGIKSFWPPRYPEDWRDSVLLGPQVS